MTTVLHSKPKVAVVGIGWWSQGWHLPFLHACPDVELVAIVDCNPNPKSKLNPNLEPLSVLSERFNCRVYSTVDDLLNEADEELDLQGILLATPHATHYELGKRVMSSHTHIHICMEKPLTTDVDDAQKLLDIVRQNQNERNSNKKIGSFMINHSANYCVQARQAREVVLSGQIGTVKHITASFASPLKWIFEEKSHVGWNEPTGTMIGNGFSWGQMCHLIGWVYHVVPTIVPQCVSCDMVHSSKTGADIAVTATVRCQTTGTKHPSSSSSEEEKIHNNEDDGVAVMSLSGTTLLPGWEHSEDSVGKRIHIEIYGTHGAVFYAGIDDQPTSGKLILSDVDGKHTVLNDSFEFEQLDYSGQGPESLRNWIRACQGCDDYYVGADCQLGLQTVQTVAAMYESDNKKQPVLLKKA
jgi:predicted dehydrogenase